MDDIKYAYDPKQAKIDCEGKKWVGLPVADVGQVIDQEDNLEKIITDKVTINLNDYKFTFKECIEMIDKALTIKLLPKKLVWERDSENMNAIWNRCDYNAKLFDIGGYILTFVITEYGNCNYNINISRGCLIFSDIKNECKSLEEAKHLCQELYYKMFLSMIGDKDEEKQ